MGIFTKRQGDQTWVVDIRPAYEAANSVITELNQALDDESLQDQFRALQDVLNRLPLIERAVKQIPEPSSVEARNAHKALKSALKNYITGSKQGRNFFNDMSGGPGQRASNETGMAGRAAFGRLAFSQHSFAELTKSGRDEIALVSDYLRQVS